MRAGGDRLDQTDLAAGVIHQREAQASVLIASDGQVVCRKGYTRADGNRSHWPRGLAAARERSAQPEAREQKSADKSQKLPPGKSHYPYPKAFSQIRCC